MTQCFSPADTQLFENTDYLSSASLFQNLGRADTLEPLVISGVQFWFLQRSQNDFYIPGTKKPATSPASIPRWIVSFWCPNSDLSTDLISGPI
jgi:hypothetical protein